MAAYRRLAKLRTLFGVAAGLGALTLLSYAFSMTAAGELVVAIVFLVCKRDAGGVRGTYSSGSSPCVPGQQCRALAVQLLMGHSCCAFSAGVLNDLMRSHLRPPFPS